MIARTVDSVREDQAGRAYAGGLILLGAGLAANTMIGPLFADLIDYPFSETVYNETLGLEAVTLLLAAPTAVAAGLLSARQHPAGPLLAFAPTSYGAYMLIQYIVGPQYGEYRPVIAWHLLLLIISLGLLLRSWTLADPGIVPARRTRWAVIVIALTAFVLSRWLPAIAGIINGEAVPVAPEDLTMYWSIFLLDLGVVVPAAVATAVGLLKDRSWSRKALFAVVGWFALVPPSVAAMSVVKIVRDDPAANVGDAVLFLVVAGLSTGLAAALYRPLFPRRTARRSH